MNNFVFNSASIPIYSGNAEELCDIIFSSFSSFISEANNPNPTLFIEKDIADIYISCGYSLQDYYENLINRNRELADFVVSYFETARLIDSDFKNSMIATRIIVGDDTRFVNDCSLKYAFMEDEILVSISDTSFWMRGSIGFTFIADDGSCFRKKLYNLFSSNISYLPHNAPVFSLYNNSDFIRTGRYYRNQPIFKKESANQYWYKDYFHRDTNSHYEVFNRFGHHIGEANLFGKLDGSKADNTKHLDV